MQPAQKTAPNFVHFALDTFQNLWYNTIVEWGTEKPQRNFKKVSKTAWQPPKKVV